MLDQKLIEYTQSNIYPFHMPGHKRRPIDFPNPYTIDITEIDGFDNLHHAEEILRDAQQRAAELYGAKRSFYLVNGSTCGLLAAICAAAPKKSRILVARNSHKAVYHGIFLNEYDAVYLYPEVADIGIQGQITADAVEEKLTLYPDIAAVVITSPTYDGVVSDIRSIAETVHRRGIPLIVDEAHGAHFGFGGGFPENAVKLGADVVIVSLHKTLPSFTQTALLHVCSDRIKEKDIAKYLGIFETSSPSYIFMAGMEKCIRMVKDEGQELFSNYRKLLDDFYAKAGKLAHIHVLSKADLSECESYAFDDGKILMFPAPDYLNGKELYDMLLSEYRLQMEMVTDKYVVAMTSIMDTQEGFDRLIHALYDIDQKLEQKKNRKSAGKLESRSVYTENKKVMQMRDAEDAPQQEIPLEESVGKVSAGFVFLYPPGIPIIVPGEEISGKFVKDMKQCIQLGLDVEGLSPDGRITIVN
ncbi:MAG: aminotransferase class V-fold PLP-dependent enzyme [Roseburia porci]|uniref:aminotransferase class I/II-fold pyridoxal phosphate-dependent enzyme n=1 Tax=Roseburia porci TaxID=2605790 RepID=UPI002A415F13|nr:aminotransferase class V-fold PLP-dependent enzyme [Roseburia porci]